MNAPTISLFLALLRAGILGEKPDGASLDGDWASVNIDEIRNLALRHDVVLTVYAALDGAEEPGLQRLKKELRPHFALRFAKAVNQDAEGRALLDALEQAGFDCIPLKGWFLRQLYADPLSRSMNDLDILVRRYEHGSVKRLMEELGYKGESASAWKHENYKKPPYMNVELHRRLTDDSGAIRAWEAEMWDRCRLEEGFDHVYRMAEEDFCLHHLLHMREDLSHGTLGFRRIADTWLLLRSFPDLDRGYMTEKLRALGIEDFARRMEKLARCCMDGEMPDADTETLLRYAAENSIAGAEKSYQISRMATMSEGGVRRGKWKSLRNAVFLPYDRMKAQFPVVEKYPVLLPFCWARRLLRMALYPKRNLRKLKTGSLSQEELDEMRRVLRAGGILPAQDGRD
jgi:hypothetical protein